MNARTAKILNDAWSAGNCCLIGVRDAAEVVAINTPMVTGFTLPSSLPGSLALPTPANSNRPAIQPVA